MSLRIEGKDLTPKSPPISSPTKVASPRLLARWRVRVLPSGEIDPKPPALVLKKIKEQGLGENVIYRFKHDESNRRYVGSTQNLAKRFSHYKSHVNQEKKQQLMHIENALKRSPRKFGVGIVAVLDESASLPQLHQKEESYISKFGTLARKNGYNHALPTAGDRSPKYKPSSSIAKAPVIPRKVPQRSAAIQARNRLIFTDRGPDGTEEPS